MPYITGKDRMQLTMIPESIDDYVSDENEVRVIDAFVEALDMKELGFVRYEAASTGRPGFRPQDMLKVYIYGFLNRVRSSRRLEQECKRNVELMWLINKLTPDYKTIADFRRDNSQALKQVFRQFTVICREWDMFNKEIVAIDGSKFKASNSKKNNYSDKKLARQLKYINEKIDEYIQILENTDEIESSVRNPNTEEIKNRIKELSDRKKKYEDMKKHIAESGENELSTIDPDARLMYSNNNGVDVSYNVQATVDIKHNLVADIEVINNASDSGQLYPMAERAKEILDVEKITVLIDKGYSKKYQDLIDCENNNIITYAAIQESRSIDGNSEYSADNFKYDEQNDTYICPTGEILSFWHGRVINKLDYRDYANFKACKSCPVRGKCTTARKGRVISRSEAAQTIMAIKKRMRANPELYKHRQMMNEPVFGTIKRAMGFTYLLTRGFEKVTGEVSLAFCAYNMRRAINIMGVKEIIRRLQTV